MAKEIPDGDDIDEKQVVLFPLVDLPRDVSVTSLGLLGALDLASTGCASRLFLLIAREVQRRPELIVEVGESEKVLVLLGRRLVATPTMGFLFGTGDLSTPSVKQALERRLPAGCQVIGASTSMLQALVPNADGTTVGGVPHETELKNEQAEGQICLMLGSFPDAFARAFYLSEEFCQKISDSTVTKAESDIKLKDLPVGDDWKTIVLISSPLRSIDPSKVVSVYQRCCPNAAIIGGVASNQLLLHALRKTKLMGSGIVGLAMRGNVPLTALVSRGCAALSPPMFGRGVYSTSAEEDDEEGRTLHIPEFEHQSGTQKPLDAVLSAQNQMQRGFGMLAGVRLRPDTGYVLEDISQRSFDRTTGTMKLSAPVGETSDPAPNHCEVRLFQLRPAACREDLQRLLGYVREQCEDRQEQVLGSVMFTCGGRAESFFGEDCADAKRFQDAFPSVPLLGFWAGGEIGPQALAEAAPSEVTRTGNAAFQGFTAVFGIFRVPTPSSATHLTTLSDEHIPAEVGAVFMQLAREAKERGNAAFRDADVENAISQYTRAVMLAAVPSSEASASERAVLLSNRAMAQLKRQDGFEAAFADAEAAISLDPLNAKAHYRRAQALLGLKKSGEAIKGLKDAAEVLPQEKALADLLAKTEKNFKAVST